MQKVTTCLWFDTQAEDAAKFYVSLFKNATIVSMSHRNEAVPGPTGTVLMVEFQLEGVLFQALNGGPEYRFTPAISLSVSCETQGEVDALWSALGDGGEEIACGWLRDRFGVSWQIVPEALGQMMADPDKDRAARVTRAMLKMKKLDIAALRRAYDEAA